MGSNTDAPPEMGGRAQGAGGPSHALPGIPTGQQVQATSSDKKTAPPPPDYQGAAQQQANSSAANVGAQTAANRPDQTNAFGSSVDWTHNADGSWSQSQHLGSGLQGIEDGLMRQAKDAYGKPLDDGSAARQQAIDASYSQATSRLDPQWAQRQEQQGAQLANQGLDPNSQAYRTAMEAFGRDRNDAYGSAMHSAIGEGNQAGALTFAQNLAARNAPGQELAALQGFLTMPGFQGAGAADPTQNLAAAMGQGNYDLTAWQAKNKAGADAAGGAGQAISSLIPLFLGL